MDNFNSIYQSYYAYVCTIVKSIINEDPEDITQTVFYKLSQAQGIIENDLVIKKWLSVTATRMSIDYKHARARQSKRLKTMVDAGVFEQQQDDEKNAELALIHAEALSFIHKEIKKLLPATRQVFELYYYKQMPAAEIAVKLGIKRRTVHSHLHNARTILRMQVLFKKMPR